MINDWNLLSEKIMSRLSGKVVIVTGASAGIGKALVPRLVDVGAIVVGCSRNIDAVVEMAETANANGVKKIHAVKCDVSNEESIVNLFKYVETHCGSIHAVVNNAGMSLAEPLLSGKSENWMKMLQTNVMGVAMGSREGIKLMRKLGVDDGHVLNVGSMSGHRVLNNSNTHFYAATKFAVRALTEGLRQELRNEKTHIRVTHISPGLVKTEFVERMAGAEAAKNAYSSFEVLEADDIAEGIMYALQTHPRVNVSDVLIRGTEQTT